MKRILVICTGNSCRSQIAEGYFRKYSKGKVDIHSAGIEAHGINPKAVEVMKEAGIDISGQDSKTIDRYLNQHFDYVITVCGNARENCPYFPGSSISIHQDFPDPANAIGSDEIVMQEYRKVRDSIDQFVKDFFKGL